ncbi:phosphatase PAP2 family protein [Tissierella sp. Yu-01]|uniref:phosphatase PAP2 family protein n=1 Tax=Tissierella sp. Yu-01 TaxID=3035694 RepID=UPI00240DD0E7|nr:phosphatase PAP2 family protein [Tissierella sp. Yu-01]WFA10399.1 phosphatase PAP2 family protein [Tissierella sp. Yu-01]
MKTQKYNILFSITALAIFVIMALMVRNSSEGILFDVAILEFLHKDSNSMIFSIMKFISFIGSGAFLFPVVGIAFIYSLIKKKYYVSKLLILSSLGCWVVNYVLKLLINRTRPLDFFLVEQGGLSYPSGHSMVSMSMYLTFAYLLCKNTKFKSNEKIIYTIAIIAVVLMGISRIYLGVHWPTDVIGGFLMGYLFFRMIVSRVK